MALLGKGKLQEIEFKEEIKKFMETEDKDEAITILNDALESKMQKIKEDAIEYQQSQDKSILAKRGYRQLTAVLSSSKFPAFSASKCLQNSSIIQNNSVTL